MVDLELARVKPRAGNAESNRYTAGVRTVAAVAKQTRNETRS